MSQAEGMIFGGVKVDNKLESKILDIQVYIRKGTEYYGVVGMFQ